jgi:glycosyltransferase involved in cell wall biosynthesis
MADEPLVDVVIPSRNRFSLTADAIRSVERQTYENWRVFVVDDASDDGSGEQLQDFVAERNRVQLISSAQRAGPARARHVGFEAGSGQFVAVLDSDDIWLTTKLEKQVALHQDVSTLFPRVGGVLCGHCWTDEDLIPLRPPKAPSFYASGPLCSNNMSTPLIARENLAEAGGFIDKIEGRYFQCEGVENYVRFAQYFDFVTVQEMLVLCRTHPGSRESDTSTKTDAAEDLRGVIDDHLGYLSTRPDDLASLRALLGARYLEASELGEGARQLARALRYSSLRTRVRLSQHYLPFMMKSFSSRLARSS